MDRMTEERTEMHIPAEVTTPAKQRNILPWMALCCSVAALALSAGALRLAWPAAEPEPEPVAAEESVPAYAPLEYITYKEHQLPLEEELAVSAWVTGGFVRQENGWMRYESGGVTALQGIDVSSHQGKIDWKAVADSGVSFAMIRAGYRGYGKEGRLMLDEQFHPNMQGAINAGLDVGVYFFSQATTVWEAEEEAAMLLKALEGYNVTYPVVFDWEYVQNGGARTNEVTGKTVGLMARAFCGMVEQAGYLPGVYFNQNLGYLSLDLDELSNCVFWLAEYDARPDFYYHVDLWQYSSKGTVPGIDVPVDMNLSYRKFNEPEA